MRSFKGTASLDFKLVITEQFVQAMRDAAKHEEATPFLLQAQAMHPENDEAFIELVIRNGIRIGLRGRLLDLCAESHLGATVAPVRIEMLGVIPEHDADAVPQVLRKQLSADVAETSEQYRHAHLNNEAQE